MSRILSAIRAVIGGLRMICLSYFVSITSKRDILAGAWEPEIYKGLDACDSFLVILSDDALRSEWVRKEVELAMRDDRYLKHGRIVPLLARPCEWRTMHPRLDRFQLVDFTADRLHARSAPALGVRADDRWLYAARLQTGSKTPVCGGR